MLKFNPYWQGFGVPPKWITPKIPGYELGESGKNFHKAFLHWFRHFGARLRQFRGSFFQNTFQTWFFKFCEIQGTTQTVLWKFFPHIRQKSNFRGTTQPALWKFFPHKNHGYLIILLPVFWKKIPRHRLSRPRVFGVIHFGGKYFSNVTLLVWFHMGYRYTKPSTCI